MGILWSLCLIVCGVIAAATVIVKKQPNAKELIDKLVPVQGYIGIVTLLVGLWALIQILVHASVYLHYAPLYFIIFLAMSITMVLLGFLLGFGLIKQYALSGNAEAAAKGAEFQAKIAGIQVPLGFAGVVLGIIALILSFRY